MVGATLFLIGYLWLLASMCVALFQAILHAFKCARLTLEIRKIVESNQNLPPGLGEGVWNSPTTKISHLFNFMVPWFMLMVFNLLALGGSDLISMIHAFLPILYSLVLVLTNMNLRMQRDMLEAKTKELEAKTKKLQIDLIWGKR